MRHTKLIIFGKKNHQLRFASHSEVIRRPDAITARRCDRGEWPSRRIWEKERIPNSRDDVFVLEVVNESVEAPLLLGDSRAQVELRVGRHRELQIKIDASPR